MPKSKSHSLSHGVIYMSTLGLYGIYQRQYNFYTKCSYSVVNDCVSKIYVCLRLCLFVFVYVRVYIEVYVSLYVSHFVSLSLSLSLFVSLSLSVCLSISVCLSLYLCLSVSLSMSVSLSVFYVSTFRYIAKIVFEWHTIAMYAHIFYNHWSLSVTC